jgi:3D (Asp-Asp-Asp) domain-containing protein
MPIIGLDLAIPVEYDAIPHDGHVGIARVSETVSLVQEPIPFGHQSQDSDVLELGIEQVLQPGVPGLSVTRTRVKFQDEAEVSRLRESEVIVRPPQDRLVVRGTKIVDKTATVDGVSLSYWYTMQMYATVYSPCNSGTADGSCSTGTASGRRAGKGVVAVDPGLFAVLNGQRLYIPGYGYAVIGDVGGGYIVEQNLGISRYKWIDLGFDDDNIQDMSGWITVYFLSPPPAAIPDVLK